MATPSIAADPTGMRKLPGAQTLCVCVCVCVCVGGGSISHKGLLFVGVGEKGDELSEDGVGLLVHFGHFDCITVAMRNY